MSVQEISLAKTISEMVKGINNIQAQLLSLSQTIIAIGEMIDQQFDLRVEEEINRRGSVSNPVDLSSLNGSTHTDPEVC